MSRDNHSGDLGNKMERLKIYSKPCVSQKDKVGFGESFKSGKGLSGESQEDMSKILQILKQKFFQSFPSCLKIFHFLIFLTPTSTSSLPGITCQLSQLLRQQPQHHLPCGCPRLHRRPVLTLTQLFGGIAVGVHLQSHHVAGVEVPPAIVKAAVARLTLGWDGEQ